MPRLTVPLMHDPSPPCDPLGVVRDIYACVSGGDLAGAAAMIAPDFIATQAASLPFGGTWRGHAGFAAMGAAIFEAWPDFAVSPERFFVDADTVVVLTRVSGAGGRLDQPMIERWRVVDGHAVECQPFYHDAAAAAASARGE